MSQPVVSKKTTASSWVLGIVGVALLMTSFQDPRRFFESTVLTVGERHFKKTAFNHFLNAQQVSMILQGKAPKDEKMILQMALERELLDQAACDLNIDVSEHAARVALEKYPQFQEDKKYNPQLLENFLKQSGMSLKQLIDNEKKTQRVLRLHQALMAQVKPPKLLVEKVTEGYGQKRTGLYKIFTTQDVQIQETAAQKDLMALFKSQPITSSQMKVFKGLFFPKEGAVSFSQLEEDLNAGISIEEMAQKYGQKILQWSMDIHGHDENGKEILKEMVGEKSHLELLNKLNTFEMQQSDVLSLAEGFFLVEGIQEIAPHPLTFDQARGLIEEKWKAQKKREKIQQEAQSFMKKKSKNQMMPIGPYTFEEFDTQNDPDLKNVQSILFDMTEQETYAMHGEQDKVYVVYLSEAENSQDEKIERAVKPMITLDLEHMFGRGLIEALLKYKPIAFKENALNPSQDQDPEYDNDI